MLLRNDGSKQVYRSKRILILKVPYKIVVVKVVCRYAMSESRRTSQKIYGLDANAQRAQLADLCGNGGACLGPWRNYCGVQSVGSSAFDDCAWVEGDWKMLKGMIIPFML